MSHEKERAQAERTKYWSIIGSIIGTMLGIAGSSISNEFKMNKLKKMVSMFVSLCYVIKNFWIHLIDCAVYLLTDHLLVLVYFTGVKLFFHK